MFDVKRNFYFSFSLSWEWKGPVFFFLVLELDSLERDITFRVQLWKIIIEYKNSFNNKFRKFDRRVFFNIYLKILNKEKMCKRENELKGLVR